MVIPGFRLPVGIAAVALGAVLYGLYCYPLPAWPLAIALLGYGAWLWRRGEAWLVVIPAVLPAYDLSPWSGWMVVGESDFFILVTIAIIALRHPPQSADLWPGRRAAWLAGPFLGCFALGALIGLAVPPPPDGSDNLYLTAWQTVQLVKPAVIALILLSLARARSRTHGDVMTWFGFGMVAGLGVVSVIVVAERLVFPGLLDLVQDYRVVGPFGKMHVGGGHIGAYIAFSLPFLNVCLVHRRRWSLVLLAVVAVMAAYALLVTFARTAYGAAFVGAMVAAFGAPLVGWVRRHKPSTLRMMSSIIPLLIGAAVIVIGLDTSYMGSRARAIASDLGTRTANWTAGVGMVDYSVAGQLFGMGLGSYPRIAAERLPPDRGPSNFVRKFGVDGTTLLLTMKERLYFGQKISVEPGITYRLRLQVRAPAVGSVGVSMCQKMLLYSENCQGITQTLPDPGKWVEINRDIRAPGSTDTEWRFVRFRPIELSFGVRDGYAIEIGAISLTDRQGRNHIVNGDFSDGLARWNFTDDHHWSWRIFNQYLMTYFELGVLGVLAALVLVVGSFLGAARGMWLGDPMAACLAPALAALGVSFMFDAILEAPRLALLFYLMLGFGLEYLRMVVPDVVRADSTKSRPR